ncbi:MAG: aldo/keto reductase [Oscillochloris sp.]|nr:aldo/keto reductase [Oscillochloris sp.]
MEYRKLGRSGLAASAIGIGTATFGREIDSATACAVLDRALERGITLIDTAEAYSAGRSEQIVGQWLAERAVRHRITLATKVNGTLTAERVHSSCVASLRRLDVEVIDLFQVHRWDAAVPLEETLGALHELLQAGMVRAIGCSNYAAWQLTKALWRQDVRRFARFESVQPVYNLADRRIEQELLPLCADQALGVISYSPRGAGFLTGKYHQGGPVPSGTRFDVVPAHQEIYFTPARFRIMEGLRQIATAAGMPMAQLALAWVLDRPGITSVLIGARSPEQVDEGIAAAAKLPADLRAALDRLE